MSLSTRKKSRPGRGTGITPAGDFEALLLEGGAEPRYLLRLYITGSTARSTHALANIRALCDEYLPGRYELEVIDIYQQPAAAMNEQIVAAPTLVKRMPTPLKRLVGDLSDKARVLSGLNLTAKTSVSGA